MFSVEMGARLSMGKKSLFSICIQQDRGIDVIIASSPTYISSFQRLCKRKMNGDLSVSASDLQNHLRIAYPFLFL
jgi:hypothetical protein